MALSVSVTILALLVVGCVHLALFGVAWSRRDVTGARSFLLLLAIVAVWTFAAALRFATVDRTAYRVFFVVAYLAAILTPPATLTFVLEYTGREDWLDGARVAALWTPAVVLVVAAVTNWAHGSFWTLGSLARTTPVVAYEATLGPFGWFNAVYGYLLLVAALTLLVRRAVRTRGPVRRQALVIALAVLVPFATSTLWLFGWSPVRNVDLTVFSLGITAVLSAVGLFHFDLLDLTPVARHTLVEEMDDVVLVVDDAGRITDANPAARRLLDHGGELVGTPAAAVVPAYETLVGQADGETVEVSLGHGDVDRTFSARRSAVTDPRGQPIGYLLLLRDITDRAAFERQLERRNEQLDQFASVVSHDLRNPINVVEGRVELYRATGDPAHLDAVETATDRMTTIIDDMLALARQGRTVSETERVELAAVAEDAWATVETPGASLVVETDLIVEADPDRLRQALENLFRNAVEHGSTSPDSQARQDAVEHGSTSSRTGADDTAEHGVPTLDGTRGEEAAAEGAGVTVWVRDLPDGSGFAVEDDGPGIPAAERDSVFDSGYTTNQGGTGLGLSIVRSVVEAHGWSVVVTEGEAGGARFEVTCA